MDDPNMHAYEDSLIPLQPCPFCGSVALELNNLASEDTWFVSCKSCEVQQIANYSKCVAVERWNKRIKWNQLEITQKPKNELYWAYNLPLQLLPGDGPNEATILNYMPRKESCTFLKLEDVIGEQTREEFFDTAAVMLDKLAKQFKFAKDHPRARVYYHNAEPSEWSEDHQ